MVSIIKAAASSSFFSKPEKSQEEASEEESLRSALERMGSSHQSRAQAVQRAQGDGNQLRRRRFVKDGDVQVEKHSLAGIKPRALASVQASGTARTVHFSSGSTGDSELVHLRRLLATEKKRVEEASRLIEDMQHTNKALTTRQVHADLEVTELKVKLEEAETKVVAQTRIIRGLQWDLERCEEEMHGLRKRLDAKPRGRPRKEVSAAPVVEKDFESESNADVTDSEPQPVKWWKD